MTDAAPTKIITVKLEAMMSSTLVHTQNITVPADITAEEEADLVKWLWDNTDGGDFSPVKDDGFEGVWERGHCRVLPPAETEQGEQGAQTLTLARDGDGDIQYPY